VSISAIFETFALAGHRVLAFALGVVRRLALRAVLSAAAGAWRAASSRWPP
jgi:hypothetical protein